jgi:hypothetical protein
MAQTADTGAAAPLGVGHGFYFSIAYCLMIEDVRKLIATRPFVPFTIHFSDGGQARVPAEDHVYVRAVGRVRAGESL